MKDIYLEKMLNSREERYIKQEEIISKYPFSLISFTLNIPGTIKDSPLYRKVHNEGIKSIDSTLKEAGIDVKYEEMRYLETGPEGFISVDFDSLEIKRITVDIEESHPFGRLFDIDVFDNKHIQVSRLSIGMEPRKCLICNEYAIKCIRDKTHSYEELLEKIEETSKTQI